MSDVALLLAAWASWGADFGARLVSCSTVVICEMVWKYWLGSCPDVGSWFLICSVSIFRKPFLSSELLGSLDVLVYAGDTIWLAMGELLAMLGSFLGQAWTSTRTPAGVLVTVVVERSATTRSSLSAGAEAAAPRRLPALASRASAPLPKLLWPAPSCRSRRGSCPPRSSR